MVDTGRRWRELQKTLGRERNETRLYNYTQMYSEMTNHGDLIFTQRSIIINWIFQVYTPADIVFWTMYLTFVFLNPNGNLTVFFPLGSWYIMFNFVCGRINWIGLEGVHFWNVSTFNLHIIWKATHHHFSYLKATPQVKIFCYLPHHLFSYVLTVIHTEWAAPWLDNPR
jgi:hypothetical protein